MNVADDTVGWLALATSKSVVRRATVVALIVGSEAYPTQTSDIAYMV